MTTPPSTTPASPPDTPSATQSLDSLTLSPDLLLQQVLEKNGKDLSESELRQYVSLLRQQRDQFKADEEAGKPVTGRRSKVPLKKATADDIDDLLGDL